MANRLIVFLVILPLIAACSFQRASVAKRAQTELIGMSKANLLACAGAPVRVAVVEGVELLTYPSGGKSIRIGSTHTRGEGHYTGVYSSGTESGTATYHSHGTSTAVTQHRYCEVTFVLKDGVVTKVNYSGPTGGLITKGEQCAYVVENCLSD